jgi:uncharacterized protein
MSGLFAPPSIVILGGFVLAFIFGAVSSKTNFCTMGAISDIVNMSHWGRMRMWLLTIAVAMMGTGVLAYMDWIDVSKTVYQRPTLAWLSLIVGGLIFGIGMTIAAGCTNKNLIRLGSGSIRSLVVLVFTAIASYMTLKGLFAQWRASFLDPVTIDLSHWGLSNQGLGWVLSKMTGMEIKSAILATALTLGLGIMVFVFKDRRFRSNLWQVFGSMTLGLLVVLAWYVTGHIGYGEHPETMEMVYFSTNTRTLEAMSFVAPIAYSLELLMLWTDATLRMTFGIATVLGVVLGSLAYALATKKFRWEGFASFSDLRTQLIGAVLMGFGGVTATGCTIGQGISGVSTLAIGSFIALAGIIAGSVATMHYQNSRA